MRVVGTEAAKNMLVQIQNTEAEIQIRISDFVCYTQSKGLIHRPEKCHKALTLNLDLAAGNNNPH